MHRLRVCIRALDEIFYHEDCLGWRFFRQLDVVMLVRATEPQPGLEMSGAAPRKLATLYHLIGNELEGQIYGFGVIWDI